LIGEQHELGALLDRLPVVGGDKPPLFAELEQTPGDGGWRDLVGVESSVLPFGTTAGSELVVRPPGAWSACWRARTSATVGIRRWVFVFWVIVFSSFVMVFFLYSALEYARCVAQRRNGS
jgi:hypothetical protein